MTVTECTFYAAGSRHGLQSRGTRVLHHEGQRLATTSRCRVRRARPGSDGRSEPVPTIGRRDLRSKPLVWPMNQFAITRRNEPIKAVTTVPL